MRDQPRTSAISHDAGPPWAAGAAEEVAKRVATWTIGTRALEFGSGGSAVFLLDAGLEHLSVVKAGAQSDALKARPAHGALNANVRILDFELDDPALPDAILEGGKLGLVVIDAKRPEACLELAQPLLDDVAMIVANEAHRDRLWPVHQRLAPWPCTTFEDAGQSTSIWLLEQQHAPAQFARKTFMYGKPDARPRRTARLVPAEFFSERRSLNNGFSRRMTIRTDDPVARKLQDIGLIEKNAIYLAPSLYELENSSFRIDAGHKMLRHGETAYNVRLGEFVESPKTPLFHGAVTLPGRTLDLTASGAGRYSFFLLDSLPKLELLAAAGYTLDDFDTILVNSGASWVEGMLSLAIGGRARSIQAFSSRQPSFFMERSVHLEGVRSARFTPRWVHAYVERLFGAGMIGADGGGESFGPLIYISRQKSSGRTIINHVEFWKLIQSFGFREVFAEDYSPLELAARMRDARIIMSPHGAGLANIVLGPMSAKVIELFSSHFTPQYFHLARDREQDYIPFPCVDADGKNVFDRYDAKSTNKAEFNREDVMVPIAELRSLLNELCGSAEPARRTPWLRRVFGRERRLAG